MLLAVKVVPHITVVLENATQEGLSFFGEGPFDTFALVGLIGLLTCTRENGISKVARSR